MMNRRGFLTGGLAALGGAAGVIGYRAVQGGDLDPDWRDPWKAGPVRMITPTASHDRLRIKAVFDRPMANPQLMVGKMAVAGKVTDSEGKHCVFDVAGLTPDTEYRLKIADSRMTTLTDDWPLRTFPAPEATTERARFLFFTCMGGADDLRHPYKFDRLFLDASGRQRLLRRALSFKPDAAISIGDHVYWDMRGLPSLAMDRNPMTWFLTDSFDRDQPVLGTKNEAVLKYIADQQLVSVYGNAMRSTPSFFVQDDHDYFDNDIATDDLKTFPQDRFMLNAAAVTQRLYYPEFLDAPGLPVDLKTGERTSLHYGSLRYGKLAEMVIYDCRRFMDDDGEGYFIRPDVEDWIRRRTMTSPADHMINVPSTPSLWTAGKWGEWYPDFADPDSGQLSADIGKPYWNQGWKNQHDRLMAAIGLRDAGVPLMISGDLHATGLGLMHETGDHNFGDNPIVSVLSGTPGAGKHGWVSNFRGQTATVSKAVNGENLYPPVEENGFTLVDMETGLVRISQFRWTPSDGPEAIDRLEPFEVREFRI